MGRPKVGSSVGSSGSAEVKMKGMLKELHRLINDVQVHYMNYNNFVKRIMTFFFIKLSIFIINTLYHSD